MKCQTYKKCLSALCLESLELRRLKADLIACFKILRGFINVIPSDFFVWSSCHTRGHSMKLYYPDSRVTVRQFFFSVRVVQIWNKLPEEVVSAGSVSAFISRLNSMHVSFLMFCFSAVCFFIYVSFRAVVSAFWAFLSSRHRSVFYSFCCICVNKINIHSFTQVCRKL